MLPICLGRGKVCLKMQNLLRVREIISLITPDCLVFTIKKTSSQKTIPHKCPKERDFILQE